MGNADLRELAEVEETTFDRVSDSIVGIDAHNWLYRYLTTTVKFTANNVYTTNDGQEVPNIVGVIQGLPKLLEADIVPVFVFDGAVSTLKDDEVTRRREQRERDERRLEEAREEGDPIEIARLQSRTQRITDLVSETTRALLGHLDVPIVEAPAEGEAQAAHMARARDVDYVGTEDYDALLLGAPLTLRQLTSSGNPELMNFRATLSTLEISWEQLVDAAILMGTDYNEGVSGIGPKTAVREVKAHGDLWGVLNDREEHIEQADRIRQMFLDPTVNPDYDFDAEVEPDIDAAREYVRTWEIPISEVERGFNRIREATEQTGLDRWT